MSNWILTQGRGEGIKIWEEDFLFDGVSLDGVSQKEERETDFLEDSGVMGFCKASVLEEQVVNNNKEEKVAGETRDIFIAYPQGSLAFMVRRILN